MSRLYDDTAREAFSAWNWLQRGFLPHAGGVHDQPHRILTLLEVVDETWRKTRPSKY